jgi:hypothetical protein
MKTRLNEPVIDNIKNDMPQIDIIQRITMT